MWLFEVFPVMTKLVFVMTSFNSDEESKKKKEKKKKSKFDSYEEAAKNCEATSELE